MHEVLGKCPPLTAEHDHMHLLGNRVLARFFFDKIVTCTCGCMLTQDSNDLKWILWHTTMLAASLAITAFGVLEKTQHDAMTAAVVSPCTPETCQENTISLKSISHVLGISYQASPVYTNFHEITLDRGCCDGSRCSRSQDSSQC